MPFLKALLLAGLLAVFLGFTPATMAQAPAPDEPAAQLDDARKVMDAVRSGLQDGLDDVELLSLRNQALNAQLQADAAATAMAPELADVQARLAQLGSPAAGPKEAPDIATQRSLLVKTQTALDSQIKLARLLSVEAGQTAATVSVQRRSQFSARLGERTHSILGKSFWTELGEDLPADSARLQSLASELRATATAVKTATWLALSAAIALLLALRVGLHKGLLHLSATWVPAGRLRRSLHAVGVVLVSVLTPGLMAQALFIGLSWNGKLAPDTQDVLVSLVAIVWFGGYVAGLGNALLMPEKPSWRLPTIPDAAAESLRWFPLLLGVVIVLGLTASRLSTAATSSLATTVALNCTVALALGLTLSLALLRYRRALQLAVQDSAGRAAGHVPAALAAEPFWLAGARTLVWCVLLGTLLALLVGYVALGSFAINQVVWALIVLSTAYLLAVLVDDLFMTLLAPKPAAETPARAGNTSGQNEVAAAAPKTREQTAVLLSGLCRILIVLFALLLLLGPYGEGPLELIRRAGRVNEGLSIGEVNIRPAALLQAALVLVLGLLGVRLLKRWLSERYMPSTQMDASMRLSVTTLLGYLSGATVVALSMSAIGIGLERVAWVASALSVGIGFGLQAVVQNFVSGLILLAERPVKVGDWVSLAGIEGDIRRINVRATEIQMGDRSTVIVPNSEFITKIVRNVTHTDPIGLVQIKLPMPLDTDPHAAKALLLEAFCSHPGVLDQPAPNVQLDGIDSAHLTFNATGFVSSPRAAYGVKSELLFDVLARLREAGLPLTVPSTLVLAPAGGSAFGAPVVQPPAQAPPLTAAKPPAAAPGAV